MFTKVGEIINTHGISGILKVKSFTFDVNRYFEYKNIYIGDDKDLYKIKKVSFHKDFVLLTLYDVDSLDEAELLKGREIFIQTKDEAILPANHYYIHDLLGMEVYNTDDEYLGKIIEISQDYGNDIYTIKGRKNGQIPAVKEFIKKVDIKKNKMIVHLIRGLLDED